MLELRPNCECCDRDLPWDSEAMICSFECTFCKDCADGQLSGTCPNCGGGLLARPVRPARFSEKHPSSDKRVISNKPECAAGRSA